MKNLFTRQTGTIEIKGFLYRSGGGPKSGPSGEYDKIMSPENSNESIKNQTEMKETGVNLLLSNEPVHRAELIVDLKEGLTTGWLDKDHPPYKSVFEEGGFLSYDVLQELSGYESPEVSRKEYDRITKSIKELLQEDPNKKEERMNTIRTSREGFSELAEAVLSGEQSESAEQNTGEVLAEKISEPAQHQVAEEREAGREALVKEALAMPAEDFLAQTTKDASRFGGIERFPV